jgi:hypothetical protein
MNFVQGYIRGAEQNYAKKTGRNPFGLVTKSILLLVFGVFGPKNQCFSI